MTRETARKLAADLVDQRLARILVGFAAALPFVEQRLDAGSGCPDQLRRAVAEQRSVSRRCCRATRTRFASSSRSEAGPRRTDRPTAAPAARWPAAHGFLIGLGPRVAAQRLETGAAWHRANRGTVRKGLNRSLRFCGGRSQNAVLVQLALVAWRGGGGGGGGGGGFFFFSSVAPLREAPPRR